MSVVVDSRPRKVGSVLRKNFLVMEEEEEKENPSELDKMENGTQTRFGKGSKGMIQKCIKQIIIPNQKPKKRKIKLMDWKKYHRLSVIYSFIDELERDYPAICTVTVIGKSVEGRDIKMLKISNSNASNSAVWLDASIHPREWITTAVVTYIADVLVKNFQNLSNSITNKDWHIVPVLNPDGYEYTHTHDRMWRKNRACYDGEYGVDLNRNFSYGWGNNGDEGSSEDPNNVFYRGPAPFSEPESAAVRDCILNSKIPFKIFLSFHSFSEVVSFPWCCTADPCLDYVSLLEGGIIMANAIYDTNRRMYKVGNFKDIMYNASGTSIDWSYGEARIPFSYLVELRSKEHKFWLPKEEIIDCSEEALNGVKALAQFVDTKKIIDYDVKPKKESKL